MAQWNTVSVKTHFKWKVFWWNSHFARLCPPEFCIMTTKCLWCAFCTIIMYVNPPPVALRHYKQNVFFCFCVTHVLSVQTVRCCLQYIYICLHLFVTVSLLHPEAAQLHRHCRHGGLKTIQIHWRNESYVAQYSLLMLTLDVLQMQNPQFWYKCPCVVSLDQHDSDTQRRTE